MASLSQALDSQVPEEVKNPVRPGLYADLFPGVPEEDYQALLPGGGFPGLYPEELFSVQGFS